MGIERKGICDWSWRNRTGLQHDEAVVLGNLGKEQTTCLTAPSQDLVYAACRSDTFWKRKKVYINNMNFLCFLCVICISKLTYRNHFSVSSLSICVSVHRTLCIGQLQRWHSCSSEQFCYRRWHLKYSITLCFSLWKYEENWYQIKNLSITGGRCLLEWPSDLLPEAVRLWRRENGLH